MQSGATPLFLAAQNGHVDICRELIRCGASINRPRKVGWIGKTEQKSKMNILDPEILKHIRDWEGGILEMLLKNKFSQTVCFVVMNV